MSDTTITPMAGDPTVIGRVIAVTTLRLISAAHFGGGEGDTTDAQLLRDAAGRPFIPGASLAGACRGFLRSRPKVHVADIECLFGGREPRHAASNDDWTQSALSVHDATAVGHDPTSLLRDQVRINIERGTAEDTGKFDFEALEPGAAFALRLELTLRQGQADRHEGMRLLFNALLDALEYGDIRIGAHTRRGLGQIETDSWQVAALDFRRIGDVLTWLRDVPPADTAPERWGRGRHGDALASLGSPEYFYVSAELALAGSLLIRSAPRGDEANTPDAVQFRSGGKPTVPGSSLAGVLRHRATRICRTLSDNIAKGDDLVDGMFGPGFKDGRPPDRHCASRLRVDEATVQGSRAQRQTRIAIDRLTGGTRATALLEEQPEWPADGADGDAARATVRWRLEPPRNHSDHRWDAERGLLLLLLKDLCVGDLPVGGGAAIGRGVLRGRQGRIELGGPTIKRWDWQSNKKGALLLTAPADDLERWVQSLSAYLTGAA